MGRPSMRALASLVLAVILSGSLHISGQAQDASQSSDAEARRRSVRALADSLKRDGKVASVAPKDWKPSRTLWGDPAIEGVYTNIDEWGIPIQRPAEFAGRLLHSITPAEMAKIRQSRRDALLDRLANDAPAEPGTIGWYENLNVDNSRPWLVVDPPDGLVPALTPAG